MTMSLSPILDLSCSFVILDTSAARAVLRNIAIAAILNAIGNPMKTRRFIHIPPSGKFGVARNQPAR
jgi:hypothetical protein